MAMLSHPDAVPSLQYWKSCRKRRDSLRYARSLGQVRSGIMLLQTALSLRSLFKNKGWLDPNTLSE